MTVEEEEDRATREALVALSTLRDSALVAIGAFRVAVDRLAEIGQLASDHGDAEMIRLAHQSALDVIAAFSLAALPVADGSEADG